MRGVDAGDENGDGDGEREDGWFKGGEGLEDEIGWGHDFVIAVVEVDVDCS